MPQATRGVVPIFHVVTASGCSGSTLLPRSPILYVLSPGTDTVWKTESPPTGVCRYLPPAWPHGSLRTSKQPVSRGTWQPGGRAEGNAHDRRRPGSAPRIEPVAVVFCALHSVDVERPELLRQHRLGLRRVAVALAEARLARVRRVTRDGLRRDLALVVRVLWVGHAVVASDGAALRPPAACSATTT